MTSPAVKMDWPECPRCGQVTHGSLDMGRDRTCDRCGLGYEVGKDGIAWDWYNDDPWHDNSNCDAFGVT
jgi:hypothetical protein